MALTFRSAQWENGKTADLKVSATKLTQSFCPRLFAVTSVTSVVKSFLGCRLEAGAT
jgi:hypothetical protein